jgi:hypothetical protein
MNDPRPSYPSLRFAISPLRSGLGVRGPHASKGRGALPVLLPQTGPLDLPRGEGLDLLDWLGLGRPEFGAISGRELAPRCRRRLWAVERNAHPSLRARTAELLAVAEAAGEGMVLFG